MSSIAGAVTAGANVEESAALIRALSDLHGYPRLQRTEQAKRRVIWWQASVDAARYGSTQKSG